ncbi:MAG: SDR family NAD(P)-dependent oxidoreductase [Acidimicrobiia bacterium]
MTEERVVGRLEGKLAGRVVIVTGSASGIGAATVVRLGDEGATVVGFDATPHGDDVVLDVRDEAAVGAAVAAVAAEHGRIDALVNAAGVAGGGPIHLVDADEWDRVVDINLKGTFLTNKHAVAQMVEQEPDALGQRGSIVNIASIEGLEGTEGGSAYNASKGGVVILTKNIALDYGRKGIRANCVCPGFIDTPLMSSVFDIGGMDDVRRSFVETHALGRIGRPDEIAAAALFLISDDASFVSGASLVVDGGYTAGHQHGIVEMMGLA